MLRGDGPSVEIAVRLFFILITAALAVALIVL